MNSVKNLSVDATSRKVSDYVRWSQIIHSWFWRFYDHLFLLVLYNFGWVLTCFLVGWPFFHFGFLRIAPGINLFAVYFLYLLESTVSIGWAYLIFNIFVGDGGKLADIWTGLQKYFFKATGISAISGLFTALVVYNLRFYLLLSGPPRFLTFLFAVLVFWTLGFWLASCLYQWPILFFQNPSFFKVFYRSFLLVLANGVFSFVILLFFAVSLSLFTVLFLGVFIGPVFFFSFQCVVLEKQLLKYKITYQDKPLGPFLDILELERRRGWRDFLKPWENR